MSAASRLKLGIVGFGRVVELVHLPLLKKGQHFEIAGVFDLTKERAQLAERRGFAVFPDIASLLDSPVDAVVVATPPSSHLQIAEQALLAGKHVLIEKPVAVTAEEALRLQRTAERTGRLATVFHNRRFDRDFHWVRHALERNLVGQPTFVSRRHHMFGSGASFGAKSFRPEWRNERNYGGGALLDWGVHLADQLLRLEAGRIETVRASMRSLMPPRTEVEDYVRAEMTTDRGVLLSMEVHFASLAASPLWIVGGDQATLNVVSPQEAYLLLPGRSPAPLTAEAAGWPGPERIYASFAEAIREEDEARLEVTLTQAVETMKLLDAIRAAAQPDKELAYGHSLYGSPI